MKEWAMEVSKFCIYPKFSHLVTAQDQSSHTWCEPELLCPLRPMDLSGFREQSPKWRQNTLVITASMLLVATNKRTTLPAETEETL